MPPTLDGSSRLRSLDVLRGIAVVMVIVTHACSREPAEVTGVGAWAARIFALGSHGVTLFFVLSGLLISGLLFTELERTGTIALGRFWLRRGFKIWPSYYASYGFMLAAMLVRARLKGPPGAVAGLLRDAVPNLVFLQNYVRYEGRWIASWSLAIEEHFYLGLPLLLVALYALRGARRWVPAICGGVVVLCLWLRWRELRLGPEAVAVVVVYIQTHYRMDGLCLGVLLGWVQVYRPATLERIARGRWLSIGVLVIGFAAAIAHPWGDGSHVSETVGLSLISIGFAGVVAHAIVSTSSSPSTSALAKIGVYSYTIYLGQAIAWSVPGGGALDRHAVVVSGYPVRPSGLLFLAISVVAGIVVSHAIERPFLRLRDRVVPRSARVTRREGGPAR